MTPRGLRNNNPGNIRHSRHNRWQGMSVPQTDSQFVQFTDMVYGYRALMKLLKTYITKHRCSTVRDIIARWAPQKENDTRAYIATVCRRMGVHPSYEINYRSERDMCRLAEAIAYQENGVPGDPDTIRKAYELLCAE